MSKEIRNVVSIFLIAAFCIISLLSFDVKLSLGADDASYIVRANRLLKTNEFPTYQGPLYPIFLAPFIALFGINLIKLKLLSVALGVGFITFFYFSFRNRVNDFVLIVSLIFVATNSFIIYYSSQTYNEMFHFFIQSMFIFYMFYFIDHVDSFQLKDFKSWQKVLLLVFLCFLVSMSKSIGIVAAGAVILYLLSQKKFKLSGIFAGVFTTTYLIYSSLRDLFWSTKGLNNDQIDILLYKDPYQYSKGKEDVFGFMVRLYENTHIYLSKHFMKILHLRSSEVTTVVEIITYLVLIIFAVSLYISFKRNKYVFFANIFTLATLFSTFLILQTRWDSDRLILIVVPYMFLSITYVIYELSAKVKYTALRMSMLASVIFVLFYNANEAFSNIDIVTMRKNLHGDKYNGYTEDWLNYIRMSEWVSTNLPSNAYVGVRKQTMSIIFSGGRDFYSISRVPSEDADTLLDMLRRDNVTHIVIASLRRNPKMKTEYTINTVHRFASIIEVKYPGTFRQIYQIGTSEPARLYEIHYPK